MHAGRTIRMVSRLAMILVTTIAIIPIWDKSEACDAKLVPSEKSFMGVPDLSLGQQQEFSNGPEGFYCHPIIWRGKPIAWVHAPLMNGGQVIGTRCERNQRASFDLISTATVDSYDALDSEESLLEWDSVKNRVKFKKISLPMRHFFSNPSYCGSMAAYWAIEEKHNEYQVFAVIYDIDRKQIRAKQEVGTFAPFQTDNSWYLPPAAWAAKGEQVEFPTLSRPSGVSIRALTLKP